MNRTYSLTKNSDELKKLIVENPDLPIVVLAGEEANDGYWGLDVLQQHYFFYW